ncbi:hypothetical protein OF83DRAFT_1080766 [Amylostereum chailletii]|nr:hypothetical protein OF83DRAFT_1080766 [Amylostereum chailletii]
MHPRHATRTSSTELTPSSTIRLLGRTFSSTRLNIWFDALTWPFQNDRELWRKPELRWPPHPPAPALAAQCRSIFDFERPHPAKDSDAELGSQGALGAIPDLLFIPHGKFAWLADKRIIESETLKFVGAGSTCSTHIKRGKTQDDSPDSSSKTITYVNKCWPRDRVDKRNGFYSELALYMASRYLKPLQGSVVPHLIGVYSGPTGISVAMEPPHPVFWVEAHRDIPRSLKLKIVDAYKRIHAQGVLHADVALGHMLIGADASITIIDFGQSRALVPYTAVLLPPASRSEFGLEMRRVKFVLDLDDARFKEELKTHWREVQEQSATKIGKGRVANMTPFRYEDDGDPPLSRGVLESWKRSNEDIPRRIVMPGVDDKTLSAAVAKFLLAVADLESAGIVYSGFNADTLSSPDLCTTQTAHGFTQPRSIPRSVHQADPVENAAIPEGEHDDPPATLCLKRPRDEGDDADVYASNISTKKPRRSMDPTSENSPDCPASDQRGDAFSRYLPGSGSLPGSEFPDEVTFQPDQPANSSPDPSRGQRVQTIGDCGHEEACDLPATQQHNPAVVESIESLSCAPPPTGSSCRPPSEEEPSSETGRAVETLPSSQTSIPPTTGGVLRAVIAAQHGGDGGSHSDALASTSLLGRDSSPTPTATHVPVQKLCVPPDTMALVTARQHGEGRSVMTGRKRKRSQVDDDVDHDQDERRRPSRRWRFSSCIVG